jgi:hypothetical protein
VMVRDGKRKSPCWFVDRNTSRQTGHSERLDADACEICTGFSAAKRWPSYGNVTCVTAFKLVQRYP